jgi:hypothetical protein
MEADSELGLLYEHGSKVLSEFWSWRHKVILLCGATLTTMLAIVSWMYERRLGAVIALPFAFGSLVCGACTLFDARNGQIINACLESTEGHRGSTGGGELS